MTMSVDFVVTSSEVATSLFFGDVLFSGIASIGLVGLTVVCDDLALLVTLGTSSATRCLVIRTTATNISVWLPLLHHLHQPL